MEDEWYEDPGEKKPGTEEEWTDWETWGKEMEKETKTKRNEYVEARKGSNMVENSCTLR